MSLTVGQLQVILEAQTASFNAEIRRVEGTISRLEKSSTQSTAAIASGFRSVQSAIRLVSGALAGAGIALTIGELRELADEATNLRNRLNLVSASSEELESNFSAVRAIANETRVAISDTANLYNRLSVATDSLGLSQKEQLDLTRTINQTLAVSGATAAEASAGVIQFSQALASNRFSGDELRSVLEQLPALARAVATGLNVPVGALKTLGEQGKLTTDIVVRALQSQAPQIESAFAKIAPTIEQTFTVVRNELVVFVSAIDRALGASGVTSGAVLSFADNLSENLGKALNFVLLRTADLVAGIAELIGVFDTLDKTVEKAFADTLSVIEILRIGISTIVTGVQGLIAALLQASATSKAVAFNLGINKDAQGVVLAFAEADAAADRFNLSLLDTNKLIKELQTNAASDRNLGGIDNALFDVAQRIRVAAAAAQQAIVDLNKPRPVSDAKGTPVVNDTLSKAQQADLDRIIKAEQKRNEERLRAVEPLLAERQELENQITALKKISGPQALIVERDRLIAQLRRDQLDITEKLDRRLQEAPQRLDQVQNLIRELSVFDNDAAVEAKRKLDVALAGSVGADEKREALTKLAKELEDEVKNAAPNIGRQITFAVGDAFRDLLEGDASNFAVSLGEKLADAAKQNLNTALDEVLKGAGDSLQKLIQQSTGLSASSAGLLGSGIIGAIGSALANSGGKSSSSAGNVRSAVTSAQQLRGIVAGPQSIAIADVSRGLQEAFRESERLLRIIAANTRTIAERSGGSGFGADAALAGEGPTLF